jgi:hypothetical protein
VLGGADSQATEHDERKPAEREESDCATDETQAAQALPAFVFEHAPRWLPRRLLGAGCGARPHRSLSSSCIGHSTPFIGTPGLSI